MRAGGREGTRGECYDSSYHRWYTTCDWSIYARRARARTLLHARPGAPYTFCVARKTRLPCSLQSPLALYIRHMGTPFELRAFAMAFGTFLARVQKSCFSKILEVPSFRRRVPWQSEPKNQFVRTPLSLKLITRYADPPMIPSTSKFTNVTITEQLNF